MTRRALLSVSDKTGIVEFARSLAQHGFSLLSTGGTAKLLQDAGLTVVEVAEHTGFPEMLDGRVKTLHPKIHGGLLARRDVPAHLEAVESHGIELIDLVVINLYPFQATVARPDVTFEDAIENIDIGGPSMVRSAAKNWQSVAVVTDPADYPRVSDELAGGGIAASTRFYLARKAFALTARYDSAIANWLSAYTEAGQAPFGDVLNLSLERVQTLRYGENPHQGAAFYRDPDAPKGSLARAEQIQGKELSYNNLLDADAALECVRQFDDPACVIVKHNNPCGVGVGPAPSSAYEKALRTDATSAFGGILAFNRPLDGAAARSLIALFAEVVIATGLDEEARAALASKPNIRVLLVDMAAAGHGRDVRRVGGGVLVQDADERIVHADNLRVVTARAPQAAEIRDMLFAWKVVKFVKSNAIVLARDEQILGIGAGQMSRIDACKLAVQKAREAGFDLAGATVASDAFFPFADGLEVLAEAGVRSVIQPGGSVKDPDVIAAADRLGVAMALTGVRHFRH